MEEVPTLQCYEGHQLTEVLINNIDLEIPNENQFNERICNICNNNISTLNIKSYVCKQCNFNQCQNCFNVKSLPKIYGFLFDVSGSMKQSFGAQFNELNCQDLGQQNRTRYSVVMQILQRLTQERSICNDDIFSIAFGSQSQEEICDLILLIQRIKQQKIQLEEHEQNGFYHQKIYEKVLERARFLRKYYSLNQFINDFTTEESILFWMLIVNDEKFFQNFIDKLPLAVKNDGLLSTATDTYLFGRNAVSSYFKVFGIKLNDKNDIIREEIKEQLNKMKQATNNVKLFESSGFKTIKIGELTNYLSEQDKNFRISSALIESLIYGYTPMCKALSLTCNQLEKQSNLRKKVVFIFSDGFPTDKGDPLQYSKYLKSINVDIVSCFITEKKIDNPYQLYTEIQQDWSQGAKLMFEMSSEQSNFQNPLAFLARNTQFKLSTTGSSRLFIQVNNPVILKDFINQMIKARDQTNVLVDIIGKFSVDDYINSSKEVKAHDQGNEGTCYAHAIAAVYQISMLGIYKREGGYPEFKDIKLKLIQEYGKNGAVTENVIKNTCNDYRLSYKLVNIDLAKDAINAGRPLVAIFRLCEKQWKEFFNFYKRNPQGILESVGPLAGNTKGHAVVLVGYDQGYLRFLNSYGKNFGDEGYFKIKSDTVLNKMTFFDVYWTEDSLTNDEKEQLNNFEQLKEKAQSYIDIYGKILYTCPICQQKSELGEFSGDLSNAICPKCDQIFSPEPLGKIFVDYIYYGKDL